MQNNLQKIFILLSFIFLINLNAQNVTTIAGSTLGFADGVGTAAQFYHPESLAMDAVGNIFVADTYNNRIRKITPAGMVTTFAGSIPGYVDGTGSAAEFNNPTGIAVDASGNVYVADNYNNCIRKITASAVVSTFAGSLQGYVDGIGIAARFSGPHGLAVDVAGNVFVSDKFNMRIRKITPTGVVSTFAGSTAGFADGTGTAALFNSPCGIAVDHQGNVYVGDLLNYCIRKITADQVVTTLAGNGTSGYVDGTGTTAQFTFPVGVSVDLQGNVFVSDQGNHRIRKINAAGVVSTIAGGTQGNLDGMGTEAKFNNPHGVATDAAGIIFVADWGNNLIRKITVDLGIDNYLQNQLSVYPNPASSIINIELKESRAGKIILYDCNGRVLESENLTDNRHLIDISNFANGFYLLQITSDKGTISKRIVKQ